MWRPGLHRSLWGPGRGGSLASSCCGSLLPNPLLGIASGLYHLRPSIALSTKLTSFSSSSGPSRLFSTLQTREEVPPVKTLDPPLPTDRGEDGSTLQAAPSSEHPTPSAFDASLPEQAANPPLPTHPPSKKRPFAPVTTSLDAVALEDAAIVRAALEGITENPKAFERVRQKMGLTWDAWVEVVSRFKVHIIDNPLYALAPGGVGTTALSPDTVLTSYRTFVTQAARAVAVPRFRASWHVDTVLPMIMTMKKAEAANDDRRYITHLHGVGDMRRPHTWYSAARSIAPRRVFFHAGPTNSGKTYHALQALRKAQTGIYCGPLRLLALEVFESMNLDGVPTSLRTGQERREIPFAGHASVTVEMVDVNRVVDVAVVDEIQMIADVQRGASWTRAFLGLPARELHVCGDPASEPIIRALAELCGDELTVRHYTRLTPMTPLDTPLGDYSKVQPGDCIVAFSRRDIHAIRRTIEQSTNLKCCVIYGQLPPETRSQQARLFNDPTSGHDVLVASDAIGMGLNLNIRRVIFHGFDKFDGRKMAPLAPDLVKQIAGRAGRASSAYKQGYSTTLMEDDLPYLHTCLATPTNPITKAGIFPTSEHLIQFAKQVPIAAEKQVVSSPPPPQREVSSEAQAIVEGEGDDASAPPASVTPPPAPSKKTLEALRTAPLRFVPAALPSDPSPLPPLPPGEVPDLLYASSHETTGMGRAGAAEWTTGDEDGPSDVLPAPGDILDLPPTELLPGTAALAAQVKLEDALSSEPFAPSGGMIGTSPSHNQLHEYRPPSHSGPSIIPESVGPPLAAARGGEGRGVLPGAALPRTITPRDLRINAALDALRREHMKITTGAEEGTGTGVVGEDGAAGVVDGAAGVVAQGETEDGGDPTIESLYQWTPILDYVTHASMARLPNFTLRTAAAAAAGGAGGGGGNGDREGGLATSTPGLDDGINDEIPLAEVIERFVDSCRLEGPYFMCRSDAALEVARLIQPFPLTLAQRCCLSLVPIGLRMLDVRRYFLRYLTEYSAGNPVRMDVQLPFNDIGYVMRDLESLEGKILAIDAYLWLGQRLGTLWFPDVDDALLKRKEAGALLEQTLVATSDQIKDGWERKQAARRRMSRQKAAQAEGDATAAAGGGSGAVASSSSPSSSTSSSSSPSSSPNPSSAPFTRTNRHEGDAKRRGHHGRGRHHEPSHSRDASSPRSSSSPPSTTTNGGRKHASV